MDLGPGVYELDVHPGSLKQASGIVPMPGGGKVHVEWKSERSGIDVRLETTRPIELRIKGKAQRVDKVFEMHLDART